MAMLAGPGWYSDPLRRHPLRYWSGESWTQYVWRGAEVEADRYGIEPAPPLTRRLAAAFRTDRETLLFAAGLALVCVLVSVLAALLSNDAYVLLAWGIVPVCFVASLGRDHSWARWTSRIGMGAVAITLLLAGAAMTRTERDGSLALGFVIVAAAVVEVLLFVPEVVRFVAKALPIDADDYRHQFTLQVAVLLLTFWASYQLSDSALDANRYQAADILDFLAGELPILVAGFIGAGFLVRRNLRETISRLGFRKPTWRRVLLAFFAAEGLLVITSIGVFITSVLTPDTYMKLGNVSDKMYSGFGADLLPWLVLSVAAGLCEETLFRGCLQARLGIVATVVLFASLHIQYGFSIFLLVIVIDGLVFALLRKYFDTTTAAIAHASCDALLSIQLSGGVVVIGLAIQALMVALLIWTSRDRLALLLSPRKVNPEPAAP